MGDSNRIGLRVVQEGAGSTGTLTLTGTMSADDTVTIGGRVYTMKVAAAAADEVTIGASPQETAQNLARALNDEGVAGTNYGTGTAANEYVYGEVSGDDLVVTARKYGTDGDTITTTVSSVDGSWGGATLAGGANLGTTPTDSPNWLALCFLDEGMGPSLNYDQSARICGGFGGDARMQKRRTISSGAPGGAINGEVVYSTVLHELIANALSSVWLPDFDNAGRERCFVDVIERAMSLEKVYLEFPGLFERFRGNVVSSFTITVPWGGKATWAVELMAREHDADQTVSIVGSGTVTGEPDNDVVQGGDNNISLEFGGSLIPGMVINQTTLNITGGMRAVNGFKASGSPRGPQRHNLGRMRVTGSFRPYFGRDSYDLYKAALANTDQRLTVGITDAQGNQFGWELPEISIDAIPPNSPGEDQDITPNMTFMTHSTRPYFWRQPA